MKKLSFHLGDSPQLAEGSYNHARDRDAAFPRDLRATRFHAFVLHMRAAITLGLVLAFLAGCAADQKKLSPVSSQVRRLQKALTDLTEAYKNKDAQHFFSLLDPSFPFPGKFKDRAGENFNTFSAVNVQLGLERVQVEKESVITFIRWRGKWTSASEPTLEKRGLTSLRWTSKEEPLLLEIKGDLLFGVF